MKTTFTAPIFIMFDIESSQRIIFSRLPLIEKEDNVIGKKEIPGIRQPLWIGHLRSEITKFSRN